MSEQLIMWIDETAAISKETWDKVEHLCRDLDEDCQSIKDKFHCWKYDPIQGVCPFLTEENKQ
jgi:hypothetical protein